MCTQNKITFRYKKRYYFSMLFLLFIFFGVALLLGFDHSDPDFTFYSLVFAALGIFMLFIFYARIRSIEIKQRYGIITRKGLKDIEFMIDEILELNSDSVKIGRRAIPFSAFANKREILDLILSEMTSTLDIDPDDDTTAVLQTEDILAGIHYFNGEEYANKVISKQLKISIISGITIVALFLFQIYLNHWSVIFAIAAVLFLILCVSLETFIESKHSTEPSKLKKSFITTIVYILSSIIAGIISYGIFHLFLIWNINLMSITV